MKHKSYLKITIPNQLIALFITISSILQVSGLFCDEYSPIFSAITHRYVSPQIITDHNTLKIKNSISSEDYNRGFFYNNSDCASSLCSYCGYALNDQKPQIFKIEKLSKTKREKKNSFWLLTREFFRPPKR